jgi:Spy/CpxP family protein refolding chaperone
VILVKKTIIFMALAFLIAGVSLVYAQTATPPAGGNRQPRGGQMGQWQGGGVAAFSDQLNLTDAQKAEIKSITDKQMAKMMEMQTAATDQINKVLTPEQKAKLEQLRKDAQEARKANKPPRNPPPAN